MSLVCITGGRLCNGCMACRPEEQAVGRCAVCGGALYEEDDRYLIWGESIHEDCLREWAEGYRVNR